MVVEYINSFVETYGLTILMFCLSAIGTGVLVELFKQSAFSKLEKKYEEDGRDASKLKTVKSVMAFFVAFGLVLICLACIYESDLPTIGGTYCVPIWFMVMFLLQLFIDIKGVKTFVGRLLGNIAATPKAPKPPKKKIVRKVVFEDEDGRPVDSYGNPLEEC